MPSCDASSLSANAICLVGFSSPQSQAIRIAILCAGLNGTTMSCDATTLINAAKCYMGIPPPVRDAVEISLLCQWVNAVAGGGTVPSGSTGGVFSGIGSPEGVVTAPVGSVYLQSDGGSFWAKESGTGNTGWVELISG